MRRLFALALLMSLVLAACGGDSGDGGDNESDQPNTTQPGPKDNEDSQSPPPTSGGDDNDSDNDGPSIATVTIGDDTYEFSSDGAVSGLCDPDMFGIFTVILTMADGGGGSVELIVLHEGTDPAVVEQNTSMHVTIDDVDWVADPEDVRIAGNAEADGKSHVDSFEIDGNTVRGSATFVGSSTVFSGDFLEFATGTFAAACSE